MCTFFVLPIFLISFKDLIYEFPLKLNVCMKFIFLLFAFTFAFLSPAQERDTLKIMSYNLLDFPSTYPHRVSDLKNIMQYYLPDILMVCELTTSAGAAVVLNDVLNENDITYYDMADYVSGPDTKNELYFNADKLGLYEQNVIKTPLRDINEYVLYYRSTDIETTNDTTFFYIYVCHLKASSGFAIQRNIEAIALKEYMANRPNRENVLLGGDFNLYSAYHEPAWNTILNGAGVFLIDPINSPGKWHENPAYAWLHTQSTRTTMFGGGATGGMDDRFDLIFMSEDFLTGVNNAEFIKGSYKALGQDGLRFNKALIDLPLNTTAPEYIINSLYQMSDHLPVYMEVAVNRATAGIRTYNTTVWRAHYNANQQQIVLKDLTELDTSSGAIYAMDGTEKLRFDDGSQSISVAHLEVGCYILKLDKFSTTFKFVIE